MTTTNYENFNNSSKSFRIYCDKLTSNDTSNNLRLTSSNNNIELKVIDEKKIIFKNDVIFNSSMDFNNKPLTGLTSISAESLNINNILSNTNFNIGFSNNILSYTNINGGYIKNTKIGYNPNIAGDKGNTIGMRPAYFTYIDVSGTDSSFNNSLYVKKNIIVDGLASITSDLSVNAIPLAAMFDKLSFVETYINNMENTSAIEFSNNRITVRDLSASNITISNELYSLNKYYANDLNISGQLLSEVLRVPHEFIIDTTSSVTDPSWVQLGPDIDGKTSVNLSGYSVSLNAAGNIVAIGAIFGDRNVIDSGVVRIYQYNNNPNDPSWVQMGPDINGEASIDQSGFSVSLNATGNIVAIGATFNDGTVFDSDRGHVRIYQYNNNPNDPSWIQMGPDIDGEASNDQSGYSVSLNSIGNIVAIGAPFNDGTINDIYDNRGHVRIYQYNNNPNDPSWVQMGPDIDSEASFDQFGYSVSLNATGNIVAIGAIFGDGNVIDSDRGHVRIYQYNNNPNDPSWIQMGPDIDGEASNDYFGRSVSLNATGNIVAIGAPLNDGIIYDNRGHVRLYQYNNNPNDPSWVQMGPDIDGEATNDQFGRSVSLNATGNIVAIGATLNDGTINDNRGHVRLYQYNNNPNDPSWIQMGPDIDGEASNDQSGYSVSLNATGNIVAIGAPLNDVTGSNSNRGHVRIYQYQETSSSFIVNGNLIVNGNKKIIKSSILDISAYIIKIATNLRNIDDLSTNPAGFDVSYIAALHYDGTLWNISGGNLLIGNQSVGLDVSLVDLQRTISGSLIASQLKYDSSFSLLLSNIENSFNNLYTKSQVDNSYVTISYAYTDISKLKNYIDLSFVTKQTFSISGSAIVQDYVSKAYIDVSFTLLNNKLDLSFALKNRVDLSYSDLNTNLTTLLTSAGASNVDISSITIENIKTSKLALSSHVAISGDLIVAGDTSSNSLNISNSYLFSNNGYSSIYSPSSNTTTIIEEYYSKFNNYGKVFYILADGSLYSLTGRGAISDIRLKENIVDASPKLADLLKVRIVDYNLKNNSNKKYIGVLAQELEELFPSLVETENGPNIEESGKSETYKSVKYSCFNVMLIKALQEQQQIITNLTLRLERLKEKKQVKENA